MGTGIRQPLNQQPPTFTNYIFGNEMKLGKTILQVRRILDTAVI